jgi:tRNA dimethylallyltransferase
VTPERAPDTDPVILLYGPTASGKSALAVELAEHLGAAIINADSLQVYAELRILTARPDAAALARAPHRLYGVLPAGTAGSVAWWRDAALAEIHAARATGLRVIVTGGTGLYLKTLMEGLSPVPTADLAARAQATALYDTLGGAAFRDALMARDESTAVRLAPGDRQRLIRAWEVVESTGRPLSHWQSLPRAPGHDLRFASIGILPPRETLYARINRRFDLMLELGALDEAARFAALSLPRELPANKALGLPELRRHLEGEITLADAARLACQASRNYAKRQMTWFRHQMAAGKESAEPSPPQMIIEEFSERNLSEIISFILGPG